MNLFEMVVLSVLIVTIGKVLVSRYGTKNVLPRDEKRAALAAVPQLQLPDAVSAEEAERIKTEIKALNERLTVLEHIATDLAKQPADEIDSLKL